MGIGIFRRAFVLRRFGEEQTVDGYGRAPYTDQVVSLNVQPLSSDELQALPEGESRNKRMRAFGDTVLTPADRSAGTRGDWLFYQGNMDPVGHWYECVSSQGWDHTMLSHSVKTIPLGTRRDTLDYIVSAEIQGDTTNVGDVVIYDKQTNGFKVKYTGSTASATIKLYVHGGNAA